MAKRQLSQSERSTAWAVAQEVAAMNLPALRRRAEVRRRLQAAGWEDWLTKLIVAVILELIKQQFTSGQPLPQSMPEDFIQSVDVQDA